MVKCVICTSTSYRLIYTFDYGDIVECKGCGLIFTLDPSSEQLVECVYDSSYYSSGDPTSKRGYVDYFGTERELRIAAARAFLSILDSSVERPGTLLDIGCGAGYFVSVANESGWKSVGLDISPAAINAATIQSRGEFFCGTLADFLNTCRPRNSYDAITMFDVIEHVSNPIALLETAGQLLRETGVVLLTTPRFGGPLMQSQGEAYIQFKQDHIYHFTEETLRYTLNQSGFQQCRIEPLAEALKLLAIGAPDDVMRKYTTDRDHILAVCQRHPVS